MHDIRLGLASKKKKKKRLQGINGSVKSYAINYQSDL